MLVVPRMSAVCTQTLSDLGVLGSIDVQEFQLGLIPLEKDLLSLEYDDVYRKLALVSFGYQSRRAVCSGTSVTSGRRLRTRI